MITEHSIYIHASQHMVHTEDNCVDLVVTSPPYPMIEMWDDIMSSQNHRIADNLEEIIEHLFLSPLIWDRCKSDK